MKKWLSPALNDIKKCEITPSALKFNFTADKSPHTIETHTAETKQPDLSTILFEEMYSFKQQGLYEEALSCIQRSFELNENNLNNAQYLYELADIYFRLKDFSRSANWLQKFLDDKPTDKSGLLLKAQLLLQMNDKEACLQIINALLTQTFNFADKNNYLFLKELDKFLDKLAKIFKTEKLHRRCPAVVTYQKKRRQFLRQHKTIATPNLESEPLIMNKLAKKPIELAIEKIWDLQQANTQTTNTLLHTPIEEISQAILQQVLAYKKKLWLFNYIASIFYQHNNIDSAIYLLRQALLLDDESDLILKNLGYLLLKKGEKPAAKATLSDICYLDFMTMDLIKQCQ